MKMLVAAAALATLVASPAFAQSYHPSIGSGNIAPPSDDPKVPSTVFWGSSTGAYAQAYPGGYGAFAQVAPSFGFGGYAPAAPFAYVPGNYGTWAGYGAGDTGAYAQVPAGGRRAHHTRIHRGAGAYGAYAQVPGAFAVQGSAPIYNENGSYSTDPDPNIRAQLRRESEQGEW
jgi:hypothetical protein